MYLPALPQRIKWLALQYLSLKDVKIMFKIIYIQSIVSQLSFSCSGTSLNVNFTHEFLMLIFRKAMQKNVLHIHWQTSSGESCWNCMYSIVNSSTYAGKPQKREKNWEIYLFGKGYKAISKLIGLHQTMQAFSKWKRVGLRVVVTWDTSSGKFQKMK